MQADLITRSPSHNPAIALFLTVLFGVGGQLYNGQILKAVVCMLIHMVCACLTAGLSLLVTWPVLIFDAAKIADRLRLGDSVEPWQFF